MNGVTAMLKCDVGGGGGGVTMTLIIIQKKLDMPFSPWFPRNHSLVWDGLAGPHPHPWNRVCCTDIRFCT